MSKKCGFVAIIGPPNAGKSTFQTLWSDRKSPLSRKRRRPRACGCALSSCTKKRRLFWSTRPVFLPPQRFDRAMVNEAWMGVEDADEVLVVLDAARADTPEIDLMLEGLAESRNKLRWSSIKSTRCAMTACLRSSRN